MSSHLFVSNLTAEQECDLLGLDHSVIDRYKALEKEEEEICEEYGYQSEEHGRLLDSVKADQELVAYQTYQMAGLGRVYWREDNHGYSKDQYDIKVLLQQVNRLDLLDQIHEVCWG